MCMLTISTVSALLRATHCVPCICSSRETMWWLAGLQIWWVCCGSCVDLWPLKSQRACVNLFYTMQFGHNRYALDLHSAIWLLNWFWILIQCGQALNGYISHLSLCSGCSKIMWYLPYHCYLCRGGWVKHGHLRCCSCFCTLLASNIISCMWILLDRSVATPIYPNIFFKRILKISERNL